MENVNQRIGRYTFVFMTVSAGMYNASTGRLPDL